MRRSFDYLPTIEKIGNIDIEDIGNCIIKANNDSGALYYLWIKSDFGEVRVFQLGPYISLDDGDNSRYFIKSFGFDFKRTTYAEGKLIKYIDTFLNNPSYQITQAILIEEDQLKEELKDFDILNFMRNWDD